MLLKALLIAVALMLLAGCSQPQLLWPDVDYIEVPSNHRLHEPSWSPDGTLIAVAADTASGQASGELVIINATTGSSNRLDYGCPFDEPHWSPDGTMFLYDGCNELSMTDYPSLVLRATIPGEHGEWSRDGTQLVVFEGMASAIQRPSSLRVTDLQGITATTVFSDTGPRFAFGGMAWSRTTDVIAFSFGSVGETSSSPLQRDIYVVKPDGSDLAMVARTGADEFDPSWSPDGQWLVYISADEFEPTAIGTITFAKADGSCSVRALANERLTGVDWAADGKRLAVTYRNQLYVVDIVATFGQSYSKLDESCPPS